MQSGIPARRDNKLAWYGPELRDDTGQWVFQLSDAEILEIEAAATRTVEQGISLIEINKGNFPLPLLGPKLKELARQLTDGIGFALVRRIPVERYPVQQAATMFYGIGAHLGSARMQNAMGHVLGHVRDLDKRGDQPDVRIYQTSERQTFHIDSAHRFDKAMRLSRKHTQALDLFDKFANDCNLNLSMQLEPGDMQFVYNHGLLHDRTGFQDWPDPERRRHLLRLWLSPPSDRPLPEVFTERFGSVEIGNRGGIAVGNTEPCAPIEPV